MSVEPCCKRASQARVVALVGNPNTGKSTVFNALTGYRQRVGNYPGVTVERRTGFLRSDDGGPPIEVVDLPGAYSLAVHGKDEAVVLDVLLGHQKGLAQPDVVINVVDAANLARNLFFTTQILELGAPVVVALNMVDLAEASGRRIDAKALASELGVPVVPVIAPKQIGIDELRDVVLGAVDSEASDHCQAFPTCVCAELDGLCESITAEGEHPQHRGTRVEALQTLLSPGGYHEARLVERCGLRFADELAERRERIASAGESVVEVEARVRYAWIDRVVQRVVDADEGPRRSKSQLADRWLTHRLVGLVALVLLMGICFQSVYAWAGPIMDAIDGAFAVLGTALAQAMPPGALQSLISNGVIAGVGAVFVFLPQILILFLFIAILEDCGYMARAAFLLDRWMALVGLGGKSFIPLLSSFACAVPGILATRTIEQRRDRFVTILIAPLMSCSARLPVYVLLIGAFIPAKPLLGGVVTLQAVTLLAMYAIGVVIAVPVALIWKRTLLRGPTQPLLIELPTFKWPSPKIVFHRVFEQGKQFCVSAGTVIFAVAILVWALGYYPHPPSIAADHDMKRDTVRESHAVLIQEVGANSDPALEAQADLELQEALSTIDREEAGTYLRESLLGRLGRWIEPAVTPLGWDWRIGTAVIASFPAREVVVATMGTIYNLGEDQDEASSGLRAKLHSATWPDGRPVFNLAVALSIMVFFALCCQCAATLAAIRRETRSWRWPALTFGYMTGLAYVGALITYQIAIRFV